MERLQLVCVFACDRLNALDRLLVLVNFLLDQLSCVRQGVGTALSLGSLARWVFGHDF